ncbi:MAG TPA: hypothetical protein VFV34_21635 [Blastocatellia bacterium]|nr:hypothetical protein [Blastocatellia bacterium]
MKLYSVVLVVFALASAIVCSAVLVQRGESSELRLATPEPAAEPVLQAPFPNVTIPGVPVPGKCCLWQVEERVDGTREAHYDPPYTCDTGQTMRGDMRIKMTIKSAGLPCDQNAGLIPNNSTLEARGQVIRRVSNFAHFSGEFVIRNPGGTVLFNGYIETIDRMGSHHLFFNCEACNGASHFEGWLVGRGSPALPNHTLRAILVARGTVPSPTTASTPLTGSINGTFLKCP